MQCFELCIHGLKKWGPNLSPKKSPRKAEFNQSATVRVGTGSVGSALRGIEARRPPLPGAGGQAADYHGGPPWFTGGLLLKQECSFLIRLSSQAQLYSQEMVKVEGFSEGEFWYWTDDAEKKQRADKELKAPPALRGSAMVARPTRPQIFAVN